MPELQRAARGMRAAGILVDWAHIYRAMLGNPGWSVPLNLAGQPALEGVFWIRPMS